MSEVQFQICGDYSGAWDPARGKITNRFAEGEHFFFAKWKTGEAELGLFGIFHPALGDLEAEIRRVAKKTASHTERWESWDLLKYLSNVTPGWGLYRSSADILRIWRDPFGRLPIFFAQNHGHAIQWATRPAMLDSFTRRPRVSRLSAFLSNIGYDADRDDFWEGVYRIRAGEILTKPIHGRHSFRTWWPAPGILTDTLDGSKITTEEAAERVEQLLKRSVRRTYERGARLVSLSAGVDSSLLVALMAELDPKVEAISMHEPTAPFFDETEAIRLTLSHLKIRGTFVPIGGKMAWDQPELFHPLIDYGPSFMSEPAYYRPFLQEAATLLSERQFPRLLISGLGADQLFSCGVNQALLDRGDVSVPPFRKARLIGKQVVKRAALNLGISYLPRMRNTRNKPPWLSSVTKTTHCFRKLKPYGREEFLWRRQNQFRSEVWEYGVRLLERYRRTTGVLLQTPFLTPGIAEYAFQLPPSILRTGTHDKTILRIILGSRLPEEIATRPKRGLVDEIVWTGISRYLSPSVDDLIVNSRLSGLVAISPDEILQELRSIQRAKNLLGRRFGHFYWRAIASELWLRELESGSQL